MTIYARRTHNNNATPDSPSGRLFDAAIWLGQKFMPMDFPDMKSLERCAEVWSFRKPMTNETEASYRTALADFVQPKDYIESLEIRNKVGWDKFNDDQNKDMLRRKGFLS